MKEEGRIVASNIYDIFARIEYTNYWQDKRRELKTAISNLDDINKISYLKELKQIGNIVENIGDFLAEISDLKNESLEELKKINYKAFKNQWV